MSCHAAAGEGVLAEIDEVAGHREAKNDQADADPQSAESEDVHEKSMLLLCYVRVNGV
jgi:hypothetical protein